MNAHVVEELITDWHRLGHRTAIPCKYIDILHRYFTIFQNETYVTFYIKTITYFENENLQMSYWNLVHTLLYQLESCASNIVIRKIESTHDVSLSTADLIYFGHCMVVELGYPWISRTEQTKFVNDVLEYPDTLQESLVSLVVSTYMIRSDVFR